MGGGRVFSGNAPVDRTRFGRALGPLCCANVAMYMAEECTINWLTHARRQTLRVYDLETARLQEVARWVQHLGLREEFAALRSAAQKQVVDNIRLFPTLERTGMLKIFNKAAVDNQ